MAPRILIDQLKMLPLLWIVLTLYIQTSTSIPTYPLSDATPPTTRAMQLVTLKLSAVSTASLYNGTIVLWSAQGLGYFTGSTGSQSYYQTVTASPNGSIEIGSLQVMNMQQMFCPGTAMLPDGSIFVNGGSDVTGTVTYSMATRKWTDSSNMNISRGYNSDVLTTGNKVLTVGGSFSGGIGKKNGELYDVASGKWTRLDNVLGDVIGGVSKETRSPDPQGLFRSDNHAWLFSYKNVVTGHDMVLHAGPVSNMYLIDTSVVGGSMTFAGGRGTDTYSMNGNSVMYFPGMILTLGGAEAYGGTQGDHRQAKNTAYIIDATSVPQNVLPTTTQISSMSFSRAFCNSVILPGGNVFIVGGQTHLHLFSDVTGVLTPEIFDPSTKRFTTVNVNLTHARNYHSEAVLMVDGRIMISGGGLTYDAHQENNTNVHYDAEIYTPSNLVNQPQRPTLSRVTNHKYKSFSNTPNPNLDTPNPILDLDHAPQLQVSTSNCNNCSYELIRVSSATHGVNNDQLRIPLMVGARRSDYVVLSVASDHYPWVRSGYYWLFAIDGTGVPSMGAAVQVSRS
ncbi:hypothetical protein SeMB42_g01898 [Synchytrium endobioticum]|uniref:Uncharacterized protein n=1 Tax=Synchytrium endobioticum TaxID=286115 RepID=A0A507DKW7_9FUNG|nr:hypothetical protein SeMB42_g01898 [Synchytrium endobioticum]